ERGERGSETSGRSGAREPGVGLELAHLAEPPLELDDILGRRSLLWAEDPGRIRERRQNVAERGRGDRQPIQDVPQPGASVHGRDAAEADEQGRGPGVERGEQQLPKASAGRPQRVALVPGEKRKADRSSRLDDGPPVGGQQPAGGERRGGAETVDSRHAPPSVSSRTSAVPSPPSATGSSTVSTPWRRSPSASAAAAARAERPRLQISG